MPSSISSIWTTILFLFLALGNVSCQLSNEGFYCKSCPSAISTIRTAVRAAVAAERRMGASLLRLHFHDCFVNGCDASLLLDDNSTFTGEKTANANNRSVRGFDVIDNIKSQLERQCPRVVSCADILAVVARDAVAALGGRTWNVQLGRRDSSGASRTRANADIPAPTFNLSALIASFSNKGLTVKDLVALSGAHTIGQARCTSFRTRIYNDTNINSNYAVSLRRSCRVTGGDNNLSPLDVTSPTAFDNAYFRNLQRQRGLLHSDQDLFDGSSTNGRVKTYSSNPATFFSDFSTAMISMGAISPLTGTSGSIRTNCRVAN